MTSTNPKWAVRLLRDFFALEGISIPDKLTLQSVKELIENFPAYGDYLRLLALLELDAPLADCALFCPEPSQPDKTLDEEQKRFQEHDFQTAFGRKLKNAWLAINLGGDE